MLTKEQGIKFGKELNTSDDVNTIGIYRVYDQDENKEIEKEKRDILDLLGKIQDFNVNLSRMEELSAKQNQKLNSYQKDNKSLYRENDLLKQRIRELEGKLDSNSISYN
jgi:hypothetical protein